MDLIQSWNITEKLVTPYKVVLHLPVTDLLKQPFGIVHGGVYAVLAETAASLGSLASLSPNHHLIPVGTDIQSRHLNQMSSGILVATATPIKLGRTQHTWEIIISDKDTSKKINHSTCSLLIVEKERKRETVTNKR